ncbi:hypothetical protein [Streptacidiphilus fuscans]|uniref:Uncharacterized protein n=1 Tax=Streptacidiphilus fuscans TaxID=2789292 RepID=A0A931FCK2_9ACTN|nr:hypothetical protein [Streptacidiphilus fuscans]MBF9067265.1 hypothetical protein [Streptacidiphilus fuscans]
MGYELQAVIGGREALRQAVEGLCAARVVELEQGLAMVPMTEALFDEMADATQDSSGLGFWFLPGGFAHVLAHWSRAGAVAYVEAEYFGGVGRQCAAVWSDGTLSLGPLTLDEDQHIPAQGTPVSVALRSLGALRTTGADEFAAVGLQRHRETESWGSS